MKHRFVVSLLLLFAAAGLSFAGTYRYSTAPGDALGTRVYRLDNGLTVYLTRNTDRPVVQTFIAVRAGSSSDPLTATGLAHYLEHMMFKGTQQYGTTDYQKEQIYLQQIDSLYEQYGRTTDPAERRAIYRQIDSVSYLSSGVAIANEFDKLADGIGAIGVNAFTSTEMTCYHEVVPATELDRWAAIESDRFQHLVLRGFHTELEAVYEEFNMSLSEDVQRVLQAVDNLLYPELPYRQHTVLGTSEHLKNPSLVQVRRFYDTYYRPGNVAICLSGDLEYDRTIRLIDRHFGSWKDQALPEKPAYSLSPAQRRDTVLVGQSMPMTVLAWRFPAVSSPDYPIVEAISSVLQNGHCGLLDVDITQQQRLLEVEAFPYEGEDYTTFFLLGIPKPGQSAAAVRALFLEEIEKLRHGQFSDALLSAISANRMRDELLEQRSNYARTMHCVSSFIYGLDWAEYCRRQQQLSHITREDIMRVANTYFTDAYVCVDKQQGQPAPFPEVEKPAISPIEMNRDRVSAFRDSLLSLPADRLNPEFLRMNDACHRDSLAGREVLSVRNEENDLFSLTIQAPIGEATHPELALAAGYLPYLGSEKRPSEELQQFLYEQAAEISFSVSANYTTVRVTGLDKNLPTVLAILSEWLLMPKADRAIFRELCADEVSTHRMAKADQDASFDALRELGLYGKEAVRRATLTPRQMAKLRPEQLLRRFADVVTTAPEVLYYGPRDGKEVAASLLSTGLMTGSNPMSGVPHRRCRRVEKAEVLLAPYKAPNFYLLGYADWGEVYDVKQQAIVMLFNEYFNGSMGSVVFQEMRESRALAYSASAQMGLPDYAGDDVNFVYFIVSQNDKLRDCIEAFRTICNDMPLSELAFRQAKQSLLTKMEQYRYRREGILSSVLSFRRLGWEKDMNEDIYEALQHLELDDLKAFQHEHVADRTYRYLVLGDPKQLDRRYLRSLGSYHRCRSRELFVY